LRSVRLLINQSFNIQGVINFKYKDEIESDIRTTLNRDFEIVPMIIDQMVYPEYFGKVNRRPRRKKA